MPTEAGFKDVRTHLRNLVRVFLKKTRIAPTLASLFSKLSRERFPPAGLWTYLSLLAGEAFSPLQPQRVRISLPGHKHMVLALDFRVGLDQFIYHHGFHEPYTTAFLLRQFQNSDLRVVYDIGSATGYFPIMAAVMLGSRGHVQAFEPVPWIFERLRANFALNHLTNLTVHQLAIAEMDGSAALFLPHAPGPWGGNASLSKEFASHWSSPDTPIASLEVPTASVDSLIDRKLLEPPDLVRMDIETAEPLALRGMLRTLETYSPDFVVEVLPETEQELGTLFRQLGYKTYWIGPDGWLQPHEIVFRPHHFDYYATRRSPEGPMRT